MYFLRAILVSILSLVCSVSLSAFVMLATLQTTLLNRQEVKGWLQQSGVYKTALDSIVASNPAIEQQVNTASSVVGSGTVKSVLNQTFTPAYLQQSTESAIDGVYNWLEGKSPSILFSINTTALKDSFVANALSTLKQQLATLPACTNAAQFNPNNPTCIPPGSNLDTIASSLATDSSNNLSVLREPVTNQTLTQNQSTNPLTLPSQLPAIVANLQLWLVLLPIISLASGGLAILAATHRLKAARHLAGHLTFGLAVTCVGGVIIANIGRTFKLSDYTSTTNTIMTNILEPVLHQAAPAIGGRLAWVSGLLALATGSAWIALRILYSRKEHAELLKTDTGIQKPAAAAHTAAPTPDDDKPSKPADKS